MNKQTEALKILKQHNEWRRGADIEMQNPVLVGEAIDVAIEMLEQPAQEHCVNLKMDKCEHKNICKHCEQPAQEPVAWMYQTEDKNFKTNTLSVGYEPTFNGKIIPLYTHPAPSWQGLHLNEMLKIAEKYGMNYHTCWELFARAIEKALKEKNNG